MSSALTIRNAGLPAVSPEELADRFDTLSHVTKRYSGTLSEAVRTCRRLSAKESVCVLLDHDLLRAYIENLPLDSPVVFAFDWFLEKGSMEFALPTGSFLELVDTLNRFLNIRNRAARLFDGARVDSGMDQRSALEYLAKALRISDPNRLTPGQLESRMVGAFSRHRGEMIRLLRVLRHPRFTGVSTGYPRRDFQGWRSILKIRPRMHSPRDKARAAKVLERDAMNLATAAQDFIHLASKGKPGPSKRGYILVTLTASLIRLADNAAVEQELRAAAKRYFDSDFSTVLAHYPVLHAFDLTTLELMGGAATPGACKQTRIRSERCQQIFETLLQETRRRQDEDTEARSSENVAQLQEKALDIFRERTRKQIVELLEEVAEQFGPHAANTQVLELESFRSGYESLELMLHRSSSDEDRDETEDRIKRLALDFSRLFTEILDLLIGQKAMQYYTSYSGPSKARPFARVEVRQKLEKGDALLSGEVYPSSSGRGPGHFVLRWPTCCTDVDFRAALCEALNPASAHLPLQGSEGDLKSLDDDSNPLQRHGIIVETSLGNFAFSLRRSDSQWEEVLKENIERRLGRLGPFGKGLDTILYGVRVRGALGEISMDLVPNTGQLERLRSMPEFQWTGAPEADRLQRFVTIRSQYDVSKLITLFFRHTATVFAMPKNFEAALKELLAASFPQYPSTD